MNDLILAPGARVLIRDAEWLVRKVDRTANGRQAVSVVGLSQIVKDREAIFLEEIDRIELLNPADTELIADTSSFYRDSILFMESLLRQTPPTDEHLYIGYPAVPGSAPSPTPPPSTAATAKPTTPPPGRPLRNGVSSRDERFILLLSLAINVKKSIRGQIMNQTQIEKAIGTLKQELIKRFGADVELRIFGSVARGDYHEHSDIDLLVVLPILVNNAVEEQVFDMAYDIELEYGLVIGTIVYSRDFWYSDRASAMPLFRNIQREGLFV